MKAQVLCGIGDLRLMEQEPPRLKPDEVCVAVMAAGICGSDVPRVFDTGAHRMPLVPGHEFAGVVCGTGSNTLKDWQGTRVGVYPLIPCGKCAPCREGRHELCRQYDYIGSRRDGAFAEKVAVPAANLVKLPDEVTFAEAAMLEPMSVAVHAMRRGFAAAGADGDLLPETAAVCGMGTIGMMLAMFLKDAGVPRVFMIGNHPPQKERAKELGLDPSLFCDLPGEEAVRWLQERTDGGAKLVFECVGKAQTAALCVEAAAPAGAVVLVGNPHGDMTLPRQTYWKILRNQLTLTGTWNSSSWWDAADDWHYVLARLEEHRIQPEKLITHRLPLAELPEGLAIMKDKTEDYCKILIENGS